MKYGKLAAMVGLAVLLGAAVTVGYELGPRAVSAAQHWQPSATTVQAQPAEEATPTPPAKNGKWPQQTWLGVQIGAGDGGAHVDQVVKNSPAANAGLKAGDLVTAVDGQGISNAQQLIDAVAKHKRGDKVTLSVKRDGANQDIAVTLGQRSGPRMPMPFHPSIAPPAPNLPGALGNLLPELRDIPADQRFEHFRGGSFAFTDKTGQQITLEVVPGVVSNVTADTITLRPNGQNVDSSYQIGQSTRVLPGGRAQVAETVKAGDKAIVSARRTGDKAEALLIVDQTATGQRPVSPGKWQAPKPKGSSFDFGLPNGSGGSLARLLQNMLSGTDGAN